MPPAMEGWSLNHWTTREVPSLPFYLAVLVLSWSTQDLLLRHTGSLSEGSVLVVRGIWALSFLTRDQICVP